MAIFNEEDKLSRAEKRSQHKSISPPKNLPKTYKVVNDGTEELKEDQSPRFKKSQIKMENLNSNDFLRQIE